MVVQHNLTAMNSNRMLGVTTKSQAKSTEKLSSGYKINRAADDAAGLSISEKMRKQIRGLTQASSNAQDGISAVQTAEGALSEVHDMLQRLNELAVKAANGTNSENDRSYIQNEVDQLVTEIDRVSETTKFNETYLLKGDAASKSGSNASATPAEVGATTPANIQVTLANDKDIELGDYAIGTVKLDTTAAVSDTTGISSASVSADGSTELNELMAKSDGVLVFKNGTASASNSVDDRNATLWNVYDSTGAPVSGATAYTTDQLRSMGVTINLNATPGVIAANTTITINKTLVTSTEQTAKLNAAGLTLTNNADPQDLKNVGVGDDFLVTVKNDASEEAIVTAYDKDANVAALDLSLHVGADSSSNNKIVLQIATMSAKGLGLKTSSGAALKVDGKDSTNADAAIDTISAAIQKVSTQRSSLGAIQNRLEHTISNLDNVVENTTSAESSIRDTDMATEMVKYSNNNILAQAGQAMLAQANQSNQGVLSLLQ